MSGPRRDASVRGVAVASAIIAVCAGLAVWGIEHAVTGNERASRRSDVRTTLERVRTLVTLSERQASDQAAALAASRRIQDAFARRDGEALVAVTRADPSVTFLLWNGRRIGSRAPDALVAWVGVYGANGLLGRVGVAAQPTRQLLEQARGSGSVRLAYTIDGQVIAAAPAGAGSSLSSTLRRSVSDDVQLTTASASQARVSGFVPRPGFPLAPLWPLLAAAVAGALSFRIFHRRETSRRVTPPPTTVRDAVAMVGETLAATHNPAALLPVILRASVEATNAVGGTITSDGEVIASRRVPQRTAADTIEIELDVGDGRETTMTLYGPPGGFDPDAREAAGWIAEQALIALENARLHGLVQRQAVTDDLTGLPNRRRFLSQLDAEIGRSRRNGLPLSVVLADLDDFKRVNDTWGHDVGDEALKTFADVLRAEVRDVDLPVRLGGEEFGILLPDTTVEGAVLLAERVRVALARTPVETARATFNLTASFGVSSFPDVGAAGDLLNDADRWLYEAKRRGKNRVEGSSSGPAAGVG